MHLHEPDQRHIEQVDQSAPQIKHHGTRDRKLRLLYTEIIQNCLGKPNRPESRPRSRQGASAHTYRGLASNTTVVGIRE